jgi:hypothetical protein
MKKNPHSINNIVKSIQKSHIESQLKHWKHVLVVNKDVFNSSKAAIKESKLWIKALEKQLNKLKQNENTTHQSKT